MIVPATMKAQGPKASRRVERTERVSLAVTVEEYRALEVMRIKLGLRGTGLVLRRMGLDQVMRKIRQTRAA